MHSTPTPRVRALMPLWLALAVAPASGVLFALAFPAVSLWAGAYISVFGILAAVVGRRTRVAVLIGLLYGLGLYFPLVWWTARYLGPLPWIALASFEALFTAVLFLPTALAYRWIPQLVRVRWLRSLITVVTVAALWSVREFAVGTMPFGGFPWARIAYTQVDTAVASGASWVGVSGLGFLLVAVVAAALEIVREPHYRHSFRMLAHSALIPAVIVAILVIVPFFPTSPVGSIRIGAVQGNGPTGYFDHREPYAVIDAQLAATEPIFDDRVDLIAWPEGGVDGDPFMNDGIARALSQTAYRAQAPVLANAATEFEGRYFNTSFLWPENGQWPVTRADVQTHAKRNPVPFGEYVPWRNFFRFFAPDLIDLIQREYTPGTDSPVFAVADTHIGLAICFDVIYDPVIRQGIRDGAEAFVFQTNNADFRGTEENLQQLAIARMRAIETGRWVVNVSTVGTSQVIRADGTSVATLAADTAGVLIEDVELRTGTTAGIMLGAWLDAGFVVTGLGLTAAAGLRSRARKKKSA
ncbi:apolipoprotein N-acyltransferase [Microbacterium sp. YY-01]|uniref:apolipoprotein N-acyltransferase n=1 Tax=Microbacterium sp. YY-01 TaxID=3421634 RepID=UPI003D1730F9